MQDTEETEVLIEKGISNATKDRRRECGLWVFNLRPSLNLWIAKMNLFWLRLRRAGKIGEICGRNSSLEDCRQNSPVLQPGGYLNALT